VGLLGLLGTSILLAGGVMLLAGPIISLLYGQAYAPAAGLLSNLSWSLVPYTISAFISVDLVTRGRERDLLKATLVSLFLFVVLYVVMIDRYGLSGAAWAALLGESLQAFILVWVAKKFISDVPTNVVNTDDIL
jgi:O-antigen/teichoic acid export membrane protein